MTNTQFSSVLPR